MVLNIVFQSLVQGNILAESDGFYHGFYHQIYRGFQCFKHLSQRFPLGFSALPGRKTMIFLPAGLPSWHAICGQSVLNILIRRTGNDWKVL